MRSNKIRRSRKKSNRRNYRKRSRRKNTRRTQRKRTQRKRTQRKRKKRTNKIRKVNQSGGKPSRWRVDVDRVGCYARCGGNMGWFTRHGAVAVDIFLKKEGNPKLVTGSHLTDHGMDTRFVGENSIERTSHWSPIIGQVEGDDIGWKRYALRISPEGDKFQISRIPYACNPRAQDSRRVSMSKKAEKLFNDLKRRNLVDLLMIRYEQKTIMSGARYQSSDSYLEEAKRETARLESMRETQQSKETIAKEIAAASCSFQGFQVIVEGDLDKVRIEPVLEHEVHQLEEIFMSHTRERGRHDDTRNYFKLVYLGSTEDKDKVDKEYYMRYVFPDEVAGAHDIFPEGQKIKWPEGTLGLVRQGARQARAETAEQAAVREQRQERRQRRRERERRAAEERVKRREEEERERAEKQTRAEAQVRASTPSEMGAGLVRQTASAAPSPTAASPAGLEPEISVYVGDAPEGPPTPQAEELINLLSMGQWRNGRFDGWGPIKDAYLLLFGDATTLPDTRYYESAKIPKVVEARIKAFQNIVVEFINRCEYLRNTSLFYSPQAPWHHEANRKVEEMYIMNLAVRRDFLQRIGTRPEGFLSILQLEEGRMKDRMKEFDENMHIRSAKQTAAIKSRDISEEPEWIMEHSPSGEEELYGLQTEQAASYTGGEGQELVHVNSLLPQDSILNARGRLERKAMEEPFGDIHQDSMDEALAVRLGRRQPEDDPRVLRALAPESLSPMELHWGAHDAGVPVDEINEALRGPIPTPEYPDRVRAALVPMIEEAEGPAGHEAAISQRTPTPVSFGEEHDFTGTSVANPTPDHSRGYSLGKRLRGEGRPPRPSGMSRAERMEMGGDFLPKGPDLRRPSPSTSQDPLRSSLKLTEVPPQDDKSLTSGRVARPIQLVDDAGEVVPWRPLSAADAGIEAEVDWRTCGGRRCEPPDQFKGWRIARPQIDDEGSSHLTPTRGGFGAWARANSTGSPPWWQADSSINKCPIPGCTTEFWRWGGAEWKRHHCRMCGGVFCDIHAPLHEKTDVRICIPCLKVMINQEEPTTRPDDRHSWKGLVRHANGESIIE